MGILKEQVSTFTNLTPRERQIFIAELYHNAWYSEDRYKQLEELYTLWVSDPIKEKTFLNEVNETS
jgi:ABC-type multidrug transport system ATPase subunit